MFVRSEFIPLSRYIFHSLPGDGVPAAHGIAKGCASIITDQECNDLKTAWSGSFFIFVGIHLLLPRIFFSVQNLRKQE